MVEFDFAVKQSASLTGIEVVTDKIRQLSHCIFFQYANNGDTVLPPPHNLNTLLTVFRHVKTVEDAINHYQLLKTFENELIH